MEAEVEAEVEAEAQANAGAEAENENRSKKQKDACAGPQQGTDIRSNGTRMWSDSVSAE